MYLLKMSGPQNWLCLFTFRPIASKQLNGLTTINTLSWLGGAVVTYPLWVQEVPGSIPGSSKGFMFDFLFCCCCVFTFLSKNTLFITKVCNSFYKINLFSILNILQDLWPIIRVLRYRPSNFNTYHQMWFYTSLVCPPRRTSVASVGCCPTRPSRRSWWHCHGSCASATRLYAFLPS